MVRIDSGLFVQKFGNQSLNSVAKLVTSSREHHIISSAPSGGLEESTLLVQVDKDRIQGI